MKRRLITSALPYVNNVPHLGNLTQVLSADVFARFCRLKGYDTLYVCGTDEYGTATETRALEEGKTPRELCDYYHAIHKQIYEWFHISFDKFGRTSTPQQTEVTQQMFLDLDKNGYIKENTIEQLYCADCGRFLADRYVRGTCPKCGYDDARGDQCEHCGALLDPTELQQPRCSTCGSTPQVKSTKHLYIDLPGILPKYEAWIKKASVEGRWSNNAIQMTQAWIRDGLKERAITRDLKWGIPVPKAGFEDKVFYVWFDAPIGYISITKALADEKGFDWKDWWQNPDNVDLFQFIGKDNIPFHTVIFPSSLIGSGRNWTKLHHMSSTEYLNYEGGKFSKSKGIGVFGTDAVESGIPADVWRFYMFYNRPERSDTLFTWKDFQEKVNSELIGNLGNLVNRTLTFVARYYDGSIPEGTSDETFWQEVRTRESKITELLDWAELRDAFKEMFSLSSVANKAFQDGEPWKMRTENPEKAASLIRDLCYVIRDLMIMVHPYIPQYAEQVAGFFGKTIGKGKDLDWTLLGSLNGLSKVIKPEIIFRPLDDAQTAAYRERYAGSQKERSERDANKNKKDTKMADESTVKTPAAPEAAKEEKPARPADEIFNTKIALKVAVITSVEKHPEADKLYVEHIDDGSGEDRVICSGLVPYFTADELMGKHVVIADNLKPRKMRGIESRGMLLAAECKAADGSDIVEVLDCPWAAAGTPVILDGADPAFVKPEKIDADTFFAAPIAAVNSVVTINGKTLLAAGQPVKTAKVVNGEVG